MEGFQAEEKVGRPEKGVCSRNIGPKWNGDKKSERSTGSQVTWKAFYIVPRR